MNKLLLNEPPLIVLPSLASAFGLNEAIFLQQLHYWLQKSAIEIENKKWVYRTMNEWENEFPFWSYSTVKRAIGSLKKKNVLLIKKLSNNKRERVNYYAIKYDLLDVFVGQNEPMDRVNMNQTMGQNEPMDKVNMNQTMGQNDLMDKVKVSQCIYNENQRDYTENTTETTTENTHIFFMHEWNGFAFENELSKISSLSESRKKKLQARMKSGDFKQLFEEALEQITKSQYLLGSKGWKINFDWLIKNDENILKVVEGNYQDKQQKDYANSPLNNLPEANNYVVEEW